MNERYKKIEDDFKKLLAGNTLFHGYVFFGEDRGAIVDFAKRLAHLVEHDEFDLCEKFLNDFLEVMPTEKATIGIDEMRTLQDFLYRRPVVSQRRTVIIHPAEALTDEAQSALLKVVEEPPADALIILIAKTPDNLLATIASRMQSIYFSAAHSAEMAIEGSNIFFGEAITALRKDLKKNVSMAHEIVKRKVLMDRYNLNEGLQMRVVEHYTKNLPVKKYEVPRKRAVKKK